MWECIDNAHACQHDDLLVYGPLPVEDMRVGDGGELSSFRMLNSGARRGFHLDA